MNGPTSQAVATLRDDPVIVLGMHHSGTSILAEVLHRAGVFMQANMRHSESKFFTRLNDRVILGRPDRWAALPLPPVDEIMSRLAAARDEIARKALRRYVAAGYDGASRWGFKDPRSCVTLPLLLELYPRAQLVHIVRDADDVAASLAAGSKRGVGRVADLDHWRELRRQYIDRVRTYGARHAQFLELAYEEFCTRPIDTTRRVLEYIHIEMLPSTVEFLDNTIYTHRIGRSRGSISSASPGGTHAIHPSSEVPANGLGGRRGGSGDEIAGRD
jgi:hypothetical protein